METRLDSDWGDNLLIAHAKMKPTMRVPNFKLGSCFVRSSIFPVDYSFLIIAFVDSNFNSEVISKNDDYVG